jgi:hypothetical protein
MRGTVQTNKYYYENLAGGGIGRGETINSKCSWPWPSSFFPDLFPWSLGELALGAVFLFCPSPLEVAHVTLGMTKKVCWGGVGGKG